MLCCPIWSYEYCVHRLSEGYDFSRYAQTNEESSEKQPSKDAEDRNHDCKTCNKVMVKEPSVFRVGGGLLLRGTCPHYGKPLFVKRTVVAIEGNGAVAGADDEFAERGAAAADVLQADISAGGGDAQ